MDPLKVTFTLASPVLVDSEYPIHLDALLAWAVGNEAERYEHPAPWGAAEDLSVALARTEGDPWVWKASRLFFTPLDGLRLSTSMVRRHEGLRILQAIDEGVLEPKGLSAVKSDSGQYRGYQWLAASQWMEKAEAWAVGDREALTHYLSGIRFIGKLGRNGYGRVSGVTVEPCEDAERWRLRNLPGSVKGLEGVEYAPVVGCLRPPYWRKTDRVIVGEPVL